MSNYELLEKSQYLTLRLGDEVYGVDVFSVREVLELGKITRVPRAARYMRGVINVRGSVVPVIDLRTKFGMPATVKDIDTCIIVLELLAEGEATVIGALADSVEEVIDLDPESIESAPKFGTGIDTDFISGIGKLDEKFIMILDIVKIFSAEEIESFQELENTDKAAAQEPELVASEAARD